MDTNFGCWRKAMAFIMHRYHLTRTLFSVIPFLLVRRLFEWLDNSEGFGYTLIRFVADNPGAWAFHCHITWHMEAGLLMTFLSGANKLGEMMTYAPGNWKNLCAWICIYFVGDPKWDPLAYNCIKCYDPGISFDIVWIIIGLDLPLDENCKFPSQCNGTIERNINCPEE
jgi:hypothetical protein